MRASSPAVSASSGISRASRRPRRIASVHSSARTSRSPALARVALVEDEVDDGEHAVQAVGHLGVDRHLVRDVRGGDLALGAHEALGHRGLGDEEGARDLRRGQAAEGAQRQRDAGVHRQRGVTAGEDAGAGGRRPGRSRPRAPGPPRGGRAPSACAGWAGGRAGRARGAGDRSPCAAPPCVIQAPGLSGTPSRGHAASATAKASCSASSASWKSPPRWRISVARTRPDSSRKARSTALLTSRGPASPGAPRRGRSRRWGCAPRGRGRRRGRPPR